jgi:shikimate kinase
VDADDVIEAGAGCSIPEIFAREGEAAFREREYAAIARLADEPKLVLALGGGAIETAATRELLRNAPNTLLVHLEVELATTLARCRGTEHLRPILADQANLAGRYQRRLPLYRTAHVSIAVDALTPPQVVEAIVHAAGIRSYHVSKLASQSLNLRSGILAVVPLVLFFTRSCFFDETSFSMEDEQ